MALTDQWVAIPADDDLRRTFAEPGLDVDDWEPVTVPAHWRSTPAFSDADGPLLYRTEFEQDPGAGRRWWLSFDGLFYQGDVWLDGAYLGDTEGYFFPHTFEVTELLGAQQEHTLAVEVSCAPQRDRANKTNITGVFQHWDCFDPTWNPGGIWRPARLVDTGPARIAELTTRCVEANEERAVLAFAAEIDAADGVDAHIRTTVGSVDHGSDRTLAAGVNTVEWTVTIDRPRLWWPHALGDAHLQTVNVEVRLRDAAGSRVSDSRQFRTGLRRVEMRKATMRVNGERLFVKGSNQGPTRMALAEATPEDCRRDITLARQAGLDLLRLHAHVALPDTYAAADEAGMLLWQDFPLQWGYSRRIRKQAVHQARKMVSQLAHHPSIALWCGHNEPMSLDIDPEAFGRTGQTLQLGIRAMASQQLPTWNKTILDRAIKRAIRSVDDSRPILANSGIMPHLPMLETTDSHLYFGWYYGGERDLARFAKLMPSQVRFPTEFGAQAIPETDDFIDAEDWPELNWGELVERHSLQASIMERYVPREGHTYKSWKQATQEYQATVIRHHIETLRRLKYSPTGGFAQFCFADGHPAITWSVLDHNRVPKLGYEALKSACAPVIAVADRLPESVRPRQTINLGVHVVSDRRTPRTGTVTAVVSCTGPDGETLSTNWTFEGEVPADACVKVGTLDFEVPDCSGALTLSLTGRIGDDRVTNQYRTTILAG